MPQRAKATAGEARIGVDMLDRIVAAPEVRCYNGAVRGKHIDHPPARMRFLLNPFMYHRIQGGETRPTRTAEPGS